VVSDPTPPAPDAPVLGEVEPYEPAPAVSHASVEAIYAAAVRQNIDARTTVPDTPAYRLLRPHGSVQVRFLLDRLGRPAEVALQHGSGSQILDARALEIVSSGRYPPFPEAAFPGETRHLFLVTIEFRS
jgi:TonB family protein